RNVFACRRRAAGHREHVHARLGKQGSKFAAPAAGNVGFEILVTLDGDLAAEIFLAGNRAKSVLSAQVCTSLLSEGARQQGVLGHARSTGQCLKMGELTPNPEAKQSAARPGI